MAREEPIGPRKLPLGELTDEDFQELCHRLIRIEFPDVCSVDVPDGGADTLLPKPEGGWERAWNPKRYTGTIHWSKCKESLDRAVRTYEIQRMTLCFARNLTAPQQRLFQKHLLGRHPGVRVDFWDLGELQARLDESEQGKTVARHYFGDPLHENEMMLRAIRAGGDLRSTAKILERGLAVGEQLAGHDPFFDYPAYQFPDARVTPPALTPGTIMAVGRTEKGNTVRLDAVPRDENAVANYAPRLRMEFDPGAAGERAAKAIDEAIRQHKAVTVEEGIQITAEQLPPLFGDMIGKPTRGTVILTPQPPPPWGAVFHAVTDVGDETIRVQLDPMNELPSDAQLAFRGEHCGLATTIKARWTEGRGGQLQVDWQHRVDDSPAREQAHVVRFLAALCGDGQLTISDDLGGRPELKRPLRSRPSELEHLLTFFETVVAIEDWTGQEIELPDSADAVELTWVAQTADAIRRRSLGMRWESSVFAVDADDTAGMVGRNAIRMVNDLHMRLLGQEVNLGRGVLDLAEAEVRDLGPVSGSEAVHQVEFRPVGGEPLTAEWALLPPGSDAGT